MKLKTVHGLLILLIFSSCIEHSSKNAKLNENGDNLKSGLRIENGINRGLAFTDSLHNKHAITYISVTITNDSTIPIHFQTDFSLQYNHPLKESDEKFKVVILPEEWTYDGMEITDSMIHKMHQYDGKHVLQKTLTPNEKLVFAVGTLRPSPAKICGIIPSAFFVNQRKESYNDCNWLGQKRDVSNSQIELGLKLDYCHMNGSATNCIIIPCGSISHSKT